MDKMDKKSIYKLIRNFELEMGEDFIDQNESIINEKCLMFWMLGKGFISGKNIDSYCEPNNNFIDLNDMLCGSEQYYALFPNGQCEEDCHLKAMEILSELISEVEFYQKRLMDIIKEHQLDITCPLRHADLDKEYTYTTSLSINDLNNKYKGEE